VGCVGLAHGTALGGVGLRVGVPPLAGVVVGPAKSDLRLRQCETVSRETRPGVAEVLLHRGRLAARQPRMAERLVYSLDSNGYLKSPLPELIPPPPSDLNGSADVYRAARGERR